MTTTLLNVHSLIPLFYLFSCNLLAFGMRYQSHMFRWKLIRVVQMGTCAMKPRSEGGVVDARLNVYGVTNLKVVGMCHRVFPHREFIEH